MGCGTAAIGGGAVIGTGAVVITGGVGVVDDGWLGCGGAIGVVGGVGAADVGGWLGVGWVGCSVAASVGRSSRPCLGSVGQLFLLCPSARQTENFFLWPPGLIWVFSFFSSKASNLLFFFDLPGNLLLRVGRTSRKIIVSIKGDHWQAEL